jgi:hypothetical protein
VTTLDQVAVPTHHRVRTDQQPEPAHSPPRQRRQQSGEERPLVRPEPHTPATELSLRDSELMTQGQDLDIPIAVTQRKQPQGRESVGDGETGVNGR